MLLTAGRTSYIIKLDIKQKLGFYILLHQMPPSIQSAVTVRVYTLNDLPDEILTHILSFLPYKEAIRTRILSKRWLPLCHSLSVININDEGASSANTKDWTHFRQFMDAIMFSPRSQHVPLKNSWMLMLFVQ
jgi:hypothetical protein